MSIWTKILLIHHSLRAIWQSVFPKLVTLHATSGKVWFFVWHLMSHVMGMSRQFLSHISVTFVVMGCSVTFPVTCHGDVVHCTLNLTVLGSWAQRRLWIKQVARNVALNMPWCGDVLFTPCIAHTELLCYSYHPLVSDIMSLFYVRVQYVSTSRCMLQRINLTLWLICKHVLCCL